MQNMTQIVVWMLWGIRAFDQTRLAGSLARLSEERMAFMSSVYWGVMCAGRVGWAIISGMITSTWPMLFFDVIMCLLGATMILLCGVVDSRGQMFEPILWVSAVGVGLGVASALPCVYSLPPEAQVPMTPLSMAMLNAMATVGEIFFPYVIGLAFGQKAFWVLGSLMSGSMGVALVMAVCAWRASISVVFSRRLENELFDI